MNPNRKFALLTISVGVLLTLSATPAWAQATSTSTVTGQVTDPLSAVIMGAEVRLVDVSTNATRATSTNESGRYVFINLEPGFYNLTVSKEGFTQAKVQGQKVEVGSTLTLNLTLQIGATTTVVEVRAAAGAELQSTNAAVGTTLSGQSLLHLPNLGRDVSTLAVLQPATHPSGFTAGAYADQNTYTLDGGNNSDDMAGNNTSYVTNFTGSGGTQTNGNSSGVLPTPVESIEEFRVTTFNQTADFNSSIGGNIQMVTRRGTSQFHGSGYGYYFATNVGAANTWVNNHTPSKGLPYTPLPSNHRSRFGVSMGGPLTPRILGGKTYFFFNYEGSRFPNVANYEKPVPTKLMRAGVIQVPDASGRYIAYNLNPSPVTVDGVTYQPAVCPAGACDPRGIGINPIVRQLWEKYMPLPNDPIYSGGDQYNTQGYLSTIRAPLTSNTYVGRIDHDFGSNHRFFGTYRFLRLVNLTTNQVDIGGALPGNTFGQPAAAAPRTQVPGFWVAGLTSNIAPTVTNEFRYNYIRNFWQWGSANAPPQLPGLGGALEIANGNSSNAESINALIPFNVNTQNTRQRFWDGKDHLIRDDLTMIKGNHLFQFGGSYQRNFNYHMRTDNGQGINNQIVYQIASLGINFNNSPYIPVTVPANQTSFYQNLYSEVLGLVGQPQVAYTRAGANLALQPVGSVAFDESIIAYYNAYFSDTWRMKKTFTLTYGLSYGLEMPPYEANAKQVALVYQDSSLVDTEDYLAQRKKAALAGQVYNPILGFATVNNVGKGIKYPYYLNPA
ncbi:MAG: carboxypeptidase regulatory-like domain-containing protein [Acidobacteria bacterium]|nr:carboxypeptidase regulatory-like domain-containing protein [Acidobacteriota bacterium]